jgi:hypothetical protein
MDALSLLPLDFLLRLTINTGAMLLLVRGIYYRTYQSTDFFLSFFSLNLLIFLIAYVLNRVEISLGAAFGLFAVFSMLRYRTEGISITDMTYLFTGIALGLILAVSEADWILLLLFAGLILASVTVLESGILADREHAQEIRYDRMDLVRPASEAELRQDLERRTGLEIRRVRIKEIDLVRDMATVIVYTRPASRPGSKVNGSQFPG